MDTLFILGEIKLADSCSIVPSLSSNGLSASTDAFIKCLYYMVLFDKQSYLKQRIFLKREYF